MAFSSQDQQAIVNAHNAYRSAQGSMLPTYNGTARWRPVLRPGLIIWQPMSTRSSIALMVWPATLEKILRVPRPEKTLRRKWSISGERPCLLSLQLHEEGLSKRSSSLGSCRMLPWMERQWATTRR